MEIGHASCALACAGCQMAWRILLSVGDVRRNPPGWPLAGVDCRARLALRRGPRRCRVRRLCSWRGGCVGINPAGDLPVAACVAVLVSLGGVGIDLPHRAELLSLAPSVALLSDWGCASDSSQASGMSPSP